MDPRELRALRFVSKLYEEVYLELEGAETENCGYCEGGGSIVCPRCKGSGEVPSPPIARIQGILEYACRKCDGRGRITCPVCGTG